MRRRDLSIPTICGSVIVPAVLMLCALGCGGDGGHQYSTISGKVSVNGDLLQNGRIVFRPVDSSAGNGGSSEIVDGEYRLEKVPLGDNVFMFSGWKLTGQTIPGPGGKPEPERASIIPQKILEEGVKRKIEDDSTQDFAIDGPA